MKQFILLLVLTTLFACSRKDDQVAVANPTPVFFAKGTAGLYPLLIEAGNGNMAMYPDLLKYSQGYTYIGKFLPINNSGWLPLGLQIGFNAITPDTADPTLIYKTLYPGKKIFFTDSSSTSAWGRASVSYTINNNQYSNYFSNQPDTSYYITIHQVEDYLPHRHQEHVKKVTLSFNCRVFTPTRSDSIDLKNVLATIAVGYQHK